MPEFESFEYLAQHAYMIGFAPQDDDVNFEKQKHDPLIGPTICHIIANFMNKHEKVILLYHCEPSDGKQRHRNITFSKWFNAYNGTLGIFRDKIHLQVEQPDGEIRDEYLGYFASCPPEEIEIASNEFRHFAREKVAAGKQSV